MNDLASVRSRQPVGNLSRNIEDLLDLQWAAGDSVGERLAVEQRHDDERLVFVLADIVDGTDVRMIQRGRRPRFPLESFQRLMIFRKFQRQELQRHEPAKPDILRLIDDTHPAGADFLDDAIMRDGSSNHADGFYGNVWA